MNGKATICFYTNIMDNVEAVMDRSEHTMKCLFSQLGIDNGPQSIEIFITANKGIARNLRLADANIWSNAQAEFIREAIQLDSDWCEIVDTLDAMLR